MSFVPTPVEILVSRWYCSIHLVAFAMACCACSFHRSWESICMPRYLWHSTSLIVFPLRMRGGLSNGICLSSASGSNIVLLVRCSMADFVTSNWELCSSLYCRPPPSFFIMFSRQFVNLLKSFPMAIMAMLSTYPSAASLFSSSGISSMSALYMIYRIIESGSP